MIITISNEKEISTQFSLSKGKIIQIIIQHWLRVVQIKLGWINDFNKIVVNYVMSFYFYFMLIKYTFYLASKLLNTFTGHTNYVWSVDYSIFDYNQFVLDQMIKQFFSLYHHYKHHRNVICSSSWDKTIYFWDIKDNQKVKTFNGHNNAVYGIEFSPFNGGRYLCSGSSDKTVCLWDIETSKSLHAFYGHEYGVICVDFSPLQSNNNNDNKSNNIGLIGEKLIYATKQLAVFKGHKSWVNCIKYGSNELGNSVVQIQYYLDQMIKALVCGIFDLVNKFKYSPYIINSSEVGGNSNVICSASGDNTIKFCDIRSNKTNLYLMKGDEGEDGIICIKFLQ
ncbi:ribosome assembly protein 4 (RSA4) [Reticulomyxa filosa]|uniref:Ribosome assembly protein 4 (RSA4) n=1 Tax=Reticulomyxa filosa TaxID=46433 RepID=X6P5T2_RETFI|nr:ribosome assembly protein 4 (RSA4) [Reticulomyxa filosa]|eukprot:ETO33444.1 ribosome assembly protein 4 (RSA4) [Reticulomyxa filosa]